MLAWGNHLVLAILLHLFEPILDDDGLIDQMVEIWVVYVEQLKLDLVIEPLRNISCFFLFVLTSSVAYLDS
jgi:hypothetical protein